LNINAGKEPMVDNKVLRHILMNLKNAILIAENDGYCYIPDPVLRIAIKNIRAWFRFLKKVS